MHSSFPIALGLLGSYALFKLVSAFIARLRYAQRARQLGCKPAARLRAPWWDFLGLTNVKDFIQADKEKVMPDFLVQRTKMLSAQEGRDVLTMEFTLMGNRTFFTCDPKNIQALLATQFKDFGLGEGRINNFYPMLGTGIFASDGKAWEHSRALLRPQFAREQISDLDLEERHVQNMMRVLPVNGDGWTDAIDMQVLFFRLTIDSATEFLFGKSVDSQLADLPGHASSTNAANPELDEKHFAYAFDRGQAYLAKGSRFGDYSRFAHNAEFRSLCKDVHAFVDHFVRLALDEQQDLEKGAAAAAAGKGADGKYVFARAIAASTRDPLELRAQLLNILLAGRDTTASLLGWTLLLLTRHPAHYARLRAAILADFGTYDNPTDITFARLKSCAPLQHVLNESLRLYPVVPLNGRRSLSTSSGAQGTSLPRGGGPDGASPVFIPPGTEVNYSVHVMHRHPAFWGADADAFRPERWVGRRPGWEYLPFNGGPRICIGQQFALTEAGYVVVRLLQRFESVEEAGRVGKEGSMEGVRHGLTLTSCPADGVRVRLREGR